MALDCSQWLSCRMQKVQMQGNWDSAPSSRDQDNISIRDGLIIFARFPRPADRAEATAPHSQNFDINRE